MLDFVRISKKETKNGIDIYPNFVAKKSQDLMIRGGDFYAIWVEERGLWSTDEFEAIQLIDNEIDIFYKREYGDVKNNNLHKLYLWNSDTGMIDKWHKYCQKQMPDNFEMLDEKLIFSNEKTSKTDYASKRLNYPLEPGNTPAYDKLMSTLYSDEERHKIEWAIGSIVTGDSKTIQKFMVLYGSAGTGKSTVLNIIQQLFEGYYSVFDARALGSSSNAFALEAFKTNPLVAIQHDGDLSRIEDNTRLNSLVSHELMTINEKFKSTYSNRFKCFLFMGTNKPVKITDARSGLIRRLIDVTPSGDRLPVKEYDEAMNQIKFELGAIAYHCKEVYLEYPGMYDNYIPTRMMGASNDVYNFVEENCLILKKEGGISLKVAWEMYKAYCDEAKVGFPLSKRAFKEELKNYFKEYYDRYINPSNGERVRNLYLDFRSEKIYGTDDNKETITHQTIEFAEQHSILDDICSDCLAQYASEEGTPIRKWATVITKLSEIDTSRIHYVKIPENHIVIDFDIPDENGNKSFEKNLEAASKWPATYAELSKSGAGIHLHYIYTGDTSQLSRTYADYIEIKIFTGNSSLRRKLTKCNNLPIATITSGLPTKGGYNLLNVNTIQSEKSLRAMVERNLNKDIHSATKPSIDFIYKILTDAYNDGLTYDVSDMRNAVLAFAAGSTNHAEYCVKLVNKMPFKSAESDDWEENIQPEELPIAIYDIEIFPNVFFLNYKILGEENPVIRMINPSADDIQEFVEKYRLVDFNGRRYDRHILYARILGYSVEELYSLSQKIIRGSKDVFFRDAYNLGYTDVYDFCTKKQSLKKWEIELGIHHQELGLPWDEAVPEELWPKVAEYCDNDVLATEAVFNKRQGDFMTRKIQVDLVKMLHNIPASVNDTTNTLSTKIIFGSDRSPQFQFNYRDLSKPVGADQYEECREKFGEDYIFRVFDQNGLPTYMDYDPDVMTLPDGYSILPFFPGYKYEMGKSTYLGETIGEGGRVYSEPGMYGNVWDGDVASMHPHSVIFEVLFGEKYTKIFKEIVEARVAIKHRDFEKAGSLLNGALKPYLTEDKADDLAQALKIVINSIYGLTSAKFENAFRDRRNIDNIVAKRGALFMTLLKSEVQKRGYTVAHIKTDSIKIPDATPEIKKFVIKFGKEYGYSFETEAEFEKFCLVNDAVYVAKHKDEPEIVKRKDPITGEEYKMEMWWTATGKQFAVPYVFKSLFSHEPIEFKDMCETFEVKKGALYLDMNEQKPDVEEYEKELDKLESKYKKGLLSDTSFEERACELRDIIDTGHNYIFVGRVGQFCPIKKGHGGGVLYRKNDDKYYAASGTKGYRWLESENVKLLEAEANIDREYYNKLVDDAVETIIAYGDYEWFVSDDPYVGPPFPGQDDEIPYV